MSIDQSMNGLLAASEIPVSWQVAGALVVSFAGTWLLTPMARWVAHQTGIVDRPDGQRKLQRKPTALLGGVAVLAGLGVTVFAAAAAGAMDSSLESIVLVSMGLSILCAVGVVDDAWNLRPGWKLLAQIGAAVPIICAGYKIQYLSLFGASIYLGPASLLVTMAWLIACTNAVNLIDGMDGLCSTVALCVAAGATAIAALAGAENSVVCAAALAGALVGFLRYNRPPATIYLGDAGSMVIGMVLALLTMHVSRMGVGVTQPSVMVALMAVPLGDVALAMLRRRLAGKGIFQADRGHIHHRLLDSGFDVSRSLAIIAAICVAAASIAVGTIYLKSDLFALASLVALAVVLVNGQLVGHHEWSIFRNLLAQRLRAGKVIEEETAEPAVLVLPASLGDATDAEPSHSDRRAA